VHTLPLPEMQTDLNSNSKQASNEIPSASRRFSDTGHYLSSQHLQFLLRVTPPALASQRQHEVPACVTIAQSILESATAMGWGSSTLFRLANNPFGIKYSHILRAVESQKSKVESDGPWTSRPRKEDCKFRIPHSGFRIPNAETQKPEPASRIPNPAIRVSNFGTPVLSAPYPIPEPYGYFDAATWESERGDKKVMTIPFLRFPNLDEAFLAHARLLCSPRYGPAFAVRDDWKQFAERLGPQASPMDMEHCGYSTNPSYSAEIISLVSRYRLNDPRALQWFATGRDPGHRAIRLEDDPLKTSAASYS
jgi:flagellum-specific peptidoglycan hydrolase FlgJ